jgi:hypothetical protein
MDFSTDWSWSCPAAPEKPFNISVHLMIGLYRCIVGAFGMMKTRGPARLIPFSMAYTSI